MVRHIREWLLLVVIFVLGSRSAGEIGTVPPLPPLEIVRGLVSHDLALKARDAAGVNWKISHGTEAAGAAMEAWWIWWRVEQATNPANSEEFRRQGLRDLIERTSWRAVLTGELPPPIPGR